MPSSRPPTDRDDAPSRGKLRREQQARDASLARLAERLVSLGDQARRGLPLDTQLAEEIALAARLRGGTGKRRQMRRVTQLLREGDASAIQRALDPPPASPHKSPTQPADVWLERLIDEGDPALQVLIETQPDVDRGRVRQWLRAVVQARAEASQVLAEGGPQPPKSKAERALRTYLKSLLG